MLLKKKIIFIILSSLLILLFFIITTKYIFNNILETFTTNKIPVLLFGDSVLNNSNYVSNINNTTEYNLQTKLGSNYVVINNSEDGATISQCFSQLNKSDILKYVTDKTVIIILSCGGNNILQNEQPANLENNFNTLVQAIKSKFPFNKNIFVLDLYKPLTNKYNIYKPQVDEWNNIINENAKKYDYKVLKISDIITNPDDLTYDIEPSNVGAQKIAQFVSENIKN